jgi:hypothetical protein
VFVSTKGSPYARFSRALETRKLSVVLIAAAELQSIQLDDALEILMAAEKDPRSTGPPPDGSAGCLPRRRSVFADGRYVSPLVERLPQGAETIRRFARRR